MNTYSKYAAGVYVAKCTEEYKKGDVIEMTTRHGKTHNCIVFNLVYMSGGFFYYSIVREDGFNAQEYAAKRAERLKQSTEVRLKKSDEYYKTARKDSGFLSLGEPIKVGHHSERRHRRIIEQANNNMRKSIDLIEEAKQFANRAEYWKKKAKDITLGMPESLDFYEFKLEEAEQLRSDIKSGKVEKRHAYTLTYATKHVREIEKKLKIARSLWGEKQKQGTAKEFNSTAEDKLQSLTIRQNFAETELPESPENGYLTKESATQHLAQRCEQWGSNLVGWVEEKNGRFFACFNVFD